MAATQANRRANRTLVDIIGLRTEVLRPGCKPPIAHFVGTLKRTQVMIESPRFSISPGGRSMIRCAVLGATGVAGQQFLVALDRHPSFEVVRLGASERSAGKKYAQAIQEPSGRTQWYCKEPLADAMARLTVEDAAKMSPDGIDLVF